MAISSTVFVSGVSALIRLGQIANREYRDHLLNQPFEMLAPPGFPPTRDDPRMRVVVGTWLRSERPELVTDGPFRDLMNLASAGLVFNQDRPDLMDLAIDCYIDEKCGDSFDLPNRKLVISRSVVLTHKEWSGAGSRPRWGRLGLEIADIALGVISAQPEALGLSRRATEVIAALAANLSELVENDDVGPDAPESPGERLVRYFVQSSLETVAERPELFVSAERWKPIIAGIVTPLKQHVDDNRGLSFLTRERLGALLRGPLAHSVLTAVNTNADAFLTNRFGGDEVLGAVARSVLGAIAMTDQRGFDLREVFSDEGAVLVYEAALGVAKERPELFLKGIGVAGDAQRQFLRGVATALDEAPRPYQWRSGLAPQIAAISFEIAGELASRRLRAGEQTDPWAAAGAEVADHLIDAVVSGFKSITGDGLQTNAFERIFTREQALDVLRIVAGHAARTPNMLVGDAHPEVRNIAVGVARMISEEPAGLLDGEAWRAVIASAVAGAAANPGALFGIDDESVEGQVAVTLIRSVLTQAADNMKAGRRPGAILFGDTLRDALLATIAAASSNLFAAPDPGSLVLHIDSARVGSHAASLEAFIDHLLDLAVGENPELRMSAPEWLHVFKAFVAHVLAHGPAAFPPAGAAGAAGDETLRITDQLILDVLQGMVVRSIQQGEVG